ncbi:hypothetical protein [Acinetobacter rudis]|uniref:Uncharacterized protein n=1 Tax=Acinetobacter rudis TaxID=632955 RepID=A0AAW8J7P9_9GAMM|nr:hypothetical protein [Acinetobacter rudis]MDQ8935780.1 hypothetical protein [Acinetobacter rudis]MDQ8952168.1 hypothetical protein [Acinetobacter rudis]MDQ9018019.1 hypothetical protein [Acinetobacter rudis]
MLDIYLTDVQNKVQFSDYPGEHPVKFILNFKKIFPSVMELLLPVLPEDENLDSMSWESTTHDFAIFQKLLQGWGVIELRLNALSQYKDRAYADALVKKANTKRQLFKKTQSKLSSIELDYLFMHEVHGLIDSDLIDLGEKFYLPILRGLWQDLVSEQVLYAKFDHVI